MKYRTNFRIPAEDVPKGPSNAVEAAHYTKVAIREIGQKIAEDIMANQDAVDVDINYDAMSHSYMMTLSVDTRDIWRTEPVVHRPSAKKGPKKAPAKRKRKKKKGEWDMEDLLE